MSRPHADSAHFGRLGVLALSAIRGTMPKVPRWYMLGLVLSAACVTSYVTSYVTGCVTMGPHPRALHEVDGDIVYSRPVSSASYEAYLRARIALSTTPPRLDVAQREIDIALRYDPREPQLWTTKAEVASKAGDDEGAMQAIEKALALQPHYPPAMRVLAQLEGGSASASTSLADE